MMLATPSPSETTTSSAPLGATSVSARRLGVGLLAVASAGWIGWFAWWLTHLEPGPVQIVTMALALGGCLSGVTVAIGLARAEGPRDVLVPSGRGRAMSDPSRFAWAVADVVGRTRAHDLHHDIRSVVRAARRSLRRSSADYAMAAVLVDGALRLLTVVVVAAALLLGVAPLPSPSGAALGAFAIGVAGVSAAHRVLSGGRIRTGDRVRWTFSSLGEVIGREDLAGVAPRRWVGTVATIVGLNVAVALRGMSDRWTHGLRPMGDDQRMVAMLAALGLVLGALYTLATIDAPTLDNAHLAPRRLEERTARQSVLGAAVCIGLVGLLAGILPGSVDPADDDPVRIEDVREGHAVDGAGRG